MTTRWLSIVALPLAACAARQDFVPAEHATASSPDGKTAAEYEIDRGSAGQIGDVQLWTEGAYVAEVDGRERTVVEIGLDIVNRLDEAITLSQVRLDDVRVDGQRLDGVAPTRVEGPTTIAPGGEARVRAYFALPTEDNPRGVRSFEVRWEVRRGEDSYVERTAFRRDTRRFPEEEGPYWDDFRYYEGRNIQYGRPFYYFPSIGR